MTRAALAHTLCAVIACALAGGVAHALPPGPTIVCAVWPDAAGCADAVPDCTLCHTSPPARNAFGRAIEEVLAPGVARPVPLDIFWSSLPDALLAIADEDADADGSTNVEEILAGTGPGDPDSTPASTRCGGPGINPDWSVCAYDPVYAWRKVHVDVCGQSPDYAALVAFEALDRPAQLDGIDAALATCLDSRFWLGADGALWRLAHSKIRPLLAIKSGGISGPVPIANYEHDYALFAYTHSDDRDARLVLTADFHARMFSETEYIQAAHGSQRLVPSRRAGLITTRWFFVINTMFTPLPRTTAAQAYRAYLGFDISRSEGLWPPDGQELVDYDDKGVTAPTCAGCHTTLDPLSYPFSRYRGIVRGTPLDRSGTYDPARLDYFPESEGRQLDLMPEAGMLFGQRVDDLVQWAEVAANSDAFARATVADYWRLLVGHDPLPAERVEFDRLWRNFRSVHAYRIERMLAELVRTEAYGRP